MSLSNFLASLTGSATPAAAPTQQTTAAPAASASSPASAANGQSSAPALAQAGQGAAPATDPLAAWGDLFKPAAAPATDPAKAPAPVDLWNVNPEQLAKAAGGINMTSAIPKELVAKALAGDADAFMEALNKTSQMSFMMAYQASMQGVKPAMEARFDAFSKEMPSTFNKMNMDATLQSDPLLSNPAMKPVVEGLRNQILAKHPDATPQQLQQAMSEYFKAVGISVGKPQATAASAAQGTSKVIDWDNFLSTTK